MKTPVFILLLCLAMVCAVTSVAQPPEPGGGQGRRDGSRDDGRHRRFMRMLPVMAALDADEDGEISTDEIENASAALKTLDKNEDGKLTIDELRPDFSGFGGGRSAFGPPGGFPGGFGGRRSEGRGRGGPPRDGSPGGGPPSEFDFAASLMSHDQDEDGKLTKEELPEYMRERFDHLDANSDGSVDRAEIDKMIEEFRSRGFGGGGGGGSTRPDRGRPKRPPLEE